MVQVYIEIYLVMKAASQILDRSFNSILSQYSWAAIKKKKAKIKSVESLVQFKKKTVKSWFQHLGSFLQGKETESKYLFKFFFF